MWRGHGVLRAGGSVLPRFRPEHGTAARRLKMPDGYRFDDLSLSPGPAVSRLRGGEPEGKRAGSNAEPRHLATRALKSRPRNVDSAFCCVKIRDRV